MGTNRSLTERRAFLGFFLLVAACGDSRGGFEGPTDPNFGDGGASSALDAAAVQCTAVSLGAGHRPLDLFILLDRSGSMAGAPWDTARYSLEDFFAHPPSSDISSALSYFPNDIDCVADPHAALEAYKLLTVELGPLPDHAPDLAVSLDNTDAAGGTDTGAALEGTLFVATAHGRQNLDHRVAAVLVSDGVPTSCTDTAALIDLVAAALLENDTLTFAIGIGVAPVNFMNTIAAAGGTNHALSVADPSGIGDALRTAQAEAVGCEFVIPESAPDGRAVDPALVNVVVGAGGEKRTVGQYDDPKRCANREGWYYDDPTNPFTVRLCPASCDLIKATKDSTVDVTFGCATEGLH